MTSERWALTDQRILVTGASGFLGQHLCRRLSECRAEVHGLSRSARSSREPNLLWWRGDMADLATARALIRRLNPDAIVHLAGRVSAVPDRDMVGPTVNSLLVSTVNVLMAAAESGRCRVVLSGSMTEPAEAETPPNSPYSAAKWASNAYGRMFHSLYGLPVVIVRPFMTYGPGQKSGKLIPSVILSLLNRQQPRLTSGRWQADWIYVDDLIDGVVAALEVPDVLGCTLDLGTGRLVSVRAIVESLVELTGSGVEPLFGALPERPLERIRVADVDHARAKLCWKATTSLSTGLRRTVEWYARRLPEYAGGGDSGSWSASSN